MKLNYTSLQHPVEPVERRGARCRRHGGKGAPDRDGRRCRSLVLPLHGHLAPAAWAAAQAAPGLRGRLRADRRRGAAGLALAATSPSCASAACSAATSPPRPPTAASTRRSAPSAPSTPPRPRSAGTRSWSAPARASSAPTPSFGHGGMAALDSAHAALSLGLPTLLSPRLSSARPARAPPRRQPPHLHRARAAARPGRRSPVPAGDAGDRRRPRAAPRPAATACARPPADLDGYAASGLPTTTMGRALDGGPALLRRRRSPRARCLAGERTGRLAPQGLRRAGREPAAMAIAVKPAAPPRPPPRAPTPASRASSSTSSPTWSWSAASRATRSTPTAPTSSSTANTSPPTTSTRCTARPADVADFLAELATGRGAAGLLGGDDPPQGRLPALLLQAPAPRRADRRRPDRGAERAAAREEAAAGPQLRRGAEAARRAARRASRRRCATGRCSR